MVQLQYRLHGTDTVQALWYKESKGSMVQLQYMFHVTVTVESLWYRYSTGFMVQIHYRLHGTYGRTCVDGYLITNFGIFSLLNIQIGDYSTTFEVFYGFHLNL